MGIACGPAGDGCGGLLQCGTCIAPQVCGSNGQCVTPVDYEWARWPVPPESPTNYTIGIDTVTDNVTGLIWQRAMPSPVSSWADAVTYCAGLVLDGKTGWRLPTLIELLSIVDSGTTTAPAINTTAFPGHPTKPYWSSTLYAGSSGTTWYVSFDWGRSYYGGGGSVRCVWTHAPAAQVSSPGAPAGQYTTAADTVTDNKTGLVWQRAASPATYDETSAPAFCPTLDLGGFNSGWRLPTYKELQTLVDPRVATPGPTIDQAAFPSTPAAYFWVSTGYHRYVNFKIGYSDMNIPYGTGSVRCVH